MNLDFLTPEIFDMLVIANLLVAVLLIAIRFYQDMTHRDSQSEQQHVASDDEASSYITSDITRAPQIDMQQRPDETQPKLKDSQ